MNTARLLRSLGISGLLAATSLPAFAQDSPSGFDPGPVCGLVNFAFCPQPPAPPPPLPDPNAVAAAPSPLPPSVRHKRHRKPVSQPRG